MSKQPNNAAITANLLLVVVLWGANNVGTKWLVATWPPIWTGSTRFLAAGFLLLAVLRFTNWFGEHKPLTRDLQIQLWLRGGLSLASYIVVFAWALRLTAASHVALYIGASPVWALLWEERPKLNWSSVRRYGAALLAVSGVLVLFWPAITMKTGKPTNLAGELCGLAASITWANYNHQSRKLSKHISGVEIAANAMWMSGAWLLPLGLIEVALGGVAIDSKHFWVQSFCVMFGGVIPYALWNGALRHWRTSQVMLFNNLIPLTTTTWAFFFLGEVFSPTFWMAMVLIVAGVIVGQTDWSKIFKLPEGF